MSELFRFLPCGAQTITIALASKSRPWALAFISHMRSLAGTWPWIDETEYQTVWAAFMVPSFHLLLYEAKYLVQTVEALAATLERKPILM